MAAAVLVQFATLLFCLHCLFCLYLAWRIKWW